MIDTRANSTGGDMVQATSFRVFFGINSKKAELLVPRVLQLKPDGPTRSLVGLQPIFQSSIRTDQCRAAVESNDALLHCSQNGNQFSPLIARIKIVDKA